MWAIVPLYVAALRASVPLTNDVSVHIAHPLLGIVALVLWRECSLSLFGLRTSSAMRSPHSNQMLYLAVRY